MPLESVSCAAQLSSCVELAAASTEQILWDKMAETLGEQHNAGGCGAVCAGWPQH